MSLQKLSDQRIVTKQILFVAVSRPQQTDSPHITSEQSHTFTYEQSHTFTHEQSHTLQANSRTRLHTNSRTRLHTNSRRTHVYIVSIYK